MQAIPFERSRQVQTVLVTVLTLAALALLGLVLAYWTWVWLAPRPEPRAQAAVQRADGVGTALGLFGSAPSGVGVAVAAPTGIAIRLLGIVAATQGGRGYAAVQLQARDIVAVREGEDIAPGIRLAEVAPRHVILDRGGVRETLALPKPLPAPTAAVPPAVSPAAPPDVPPAQ